jgi:hypothetical protein
MLRRNGGDYAEVAITIGATEQTVRNYEKIMSLPTKVKNAVNDGQISASAAVKLSGLSNEEAESTLDKLVSESAGKKVSVSKVTRTRKKQNGGLIAPRKGTLKKLVAVESELDPEFLRGVRFAIGDLDPASVKGLKSLLADL